MPPWPRILTSQVLGTLSRFTVAIFGALPKFPSVVARKRRAVFLTLVHKNGPPLLRSCCGLLGHGGVLVEVERHHILKTQTSFLVRTRQFFIYPNGPATSGQAQYYFFSILLFLSNGQRNALRHVAGGLQWVAPDFDGQFLEGFKFVF